MRKNKIRILHVAQAAGGVDRYIRMLLKYLDKEKFENILVCSQDFHEEDYKGLLDSFEQIEMTRAIGRTDLKAIKKVRALIKKYNPDIVYKGCIECGLCIKSCPALNSGEFKNKTLVGYAATSQDITTSENSSSGGIFALIAREFLRNNSWVIGAKMESDYCLKHVAINHIEELEGLQGSKYVQSNMDGIIDKISELLSNGSQVLFSGTPCQVSGLKKAMKIKGIDVKNLVTIDIVCHGVPSPKFFREHVKFKYGKVSNIKFRHRTKHELNGYALGFQKSGNYKIIQPTNRDFYYTCFSSQVSLRESCYNCAYTTANRVGDITLGDLSTHRLYDSYFKKDRALSIVGVNTERGKHLFGNLKNVDFIKADYLKECSVNAQMNHPTARPDERDNFYIALFQNGYSEKNADEYKYRYSFKENVKNWITLNTTPSFRNKLKKLLKSNEN